MNFPPPPKQGRGILALAVCTIALSLPAAAGWPSYGGDAGGQKYSAAAQITRENAAALEEAWSYRTGDLDARGEAMEDSAFETTPILAGDKLVFCTPFNEVIALDPGTGKQIWRYDPKIALDIEPANQFVCRGVTQFDDLQSAGGACAHKIFTGTNDHRLIAVDAADGKPCAGFGNSGTVVIDPGMELRWAGEFQITSPPAVVRGVVIVGSAISDGVRVEAPAGTVRAFDAHSGAALWSFDPLVRPADGSMKSGHANVWAPMAVDEAMGLVFLPTSSPSPDFYGGLRIGDDRHANSVVALDGTTGEIVWTFQAVHHDLWDYDLASQPVLTTVKGRPAVIQGTKMGLVFVLDRVNGLPLFPVEEIPVPQSHVAGEEAWPTQPVPVKPRPLVPSLDRTEAFGLTFYDYGACLDALRALRYEGMYTPPSLEGTAEYPFTGGGINWGGVAVDPERQILVVNTMRLVHSITAVPREEFEARMNADPADAEYGRQRGAPFGMRRMLVMSPFGAPCNAPPWGMLHAIDLKTGDVLWEKPFGTAEDLVPVIGGLLPEGVPNLGGPVVTAGGLVFIGAAADNYLRAYDVETGAELWKGRLPAGGQATPMTYTWKGRQYVVIAAGGHSKAGTTLGDYVVAFALPENE